MVDVEESEDELLIETELGEVNPKLVEEFVDRNSGYEKESISNSFTTKEQDSGEITLSRMAQTKVLKRKKMKTMNV